MKINDGGIQLTDNISEANALLALQSKLKKNPGIQAAARSHDIPIYVTKVMISNITFTSILCHTLFLKKYYFSLLDKFFGSCNKSYTGISKWLWRWCKGLWSNRQDKIIRDDWCFGGNLNVVVLTSFLFPFFFSFIWGYQFMVKITSCVRHR